MNTKMESLKQTSGWRISLLEFKDFSIRAVAWGTLGLTLGVSVGVIFPPAFVISVVSGIGIGIAAGAASVYVNSQYRKIENANIAKLKHFEAEQKNLNAVDIVHLDEHQQQEIDTLIESIKNMSAEQRKTYASTLPWGHCLKEVIPANNKVNEDDVIQMRKAIVEALREGAASAQSVIEHPAVEQKSVKPAPIKKGMLAKIGGLFASIDTTAAGFGLVTSGIAIVSAVIGGIAAIPTAIAVLGALGVSLALGVATGGIQYRLIAKNEARKERIAQLKQEVRSKRQGITWALNALMADAKGARQDRSELYEAAYREGLDHVASEAMEQSEPSIEQLSHHQGADISVSSGPSKTDKASVVSRGWQRFLPSWAGNRQVQQAALRSASAALFAASKAGKLTASVMNPLKLDPKQTQHINELKKPSSWRTFLPLWFKDFSGRATGLAAIGVGIGVVVGSIFPPLLIPSLLIGIGAGIAVGAITARYASNYRKLEAEKIKKIEHLVSRWEQPEKYSTHKPEMDHLIARMAEKPFHERLYLDQSLPEGHCLKGKIPLGKKVTERDIEVMQNAVSAFVAQKAANIVIETSSQEKPSYAVKAAAKGLMTTTELGTIGFNVSSSAVALGSVFVVNPVLAGVVAVGLTATLVTGVVAGAATAKVQRAYDLKNENRDQEIQRLRYGVEVRKTAVDGVLDDIIVDTKVAMHQAARMEAAFHKGEGEAYEDRRYEQAAAVLAKRKEAAKHEESSFDHSQQLFKPVPRAEVEKKAVKYKLPPPIIEIPDPDPNPILSPEPLEAAKPENLVRPHPPKSSA